MNYNFLNLPVIKAAVKDGNARASCLILRLSFTFSTDTLYTSDNMETQACVRETSTLHPDISLQLFGEWHLWCFLHGYITSGRKAVNHGKKVNLEHAARADCAEADGRCASTWVWPPHCYKDAVRPLCQHLFSCVIPFIYETLLSNNMDFTNVASVWENVTVEICAQEKTITLTDSDSDRNECITLLQFFIIGLTP